MSRLRSELLNYVMGGRERRNLELKARLDWDDLTLRSKLVKSIMAMANLRDGGALVLGVTNDGAPVGLTQTEAVFWTHDRVAAEVNKYASPYVDLAVSVGHGDDASRWFVVIEVTEFAEIPVMCRDGSHFRAGTIYVRARRMNETTEIRTEADTRELIDLAIDKGIRGFKRRQNLADPSPNVQGQTLAEYAAELGDL